MSAVRTAGLAEKYKNAEVKGNFANEHTQLRCPTLHRFYARQFTKKRWRFFTYTCISLLTFSQCVSCVDEHLMYLFFPFPNTFLRVQLNPSHFYKAHAASKVLFANACVSVYGISIITGLFMSASR